MEDLELVFTLEEQITKNGYEEGYQDGLIVGRREGQSLGRSHGSTAAKDFGHYYGFSVVACKRLDKKPKMSRSEQTAYKLLKSIMDNANEIKKYENGSDSLSNFHALLAKSKKQFEDARRYLRMKNNYNVEDNSLSF